MANLSLLDLLELPTGARCDENILPNIAGLKRKCEIFYRLSDKEAYSVLMSSELLRCPKDLPILPAQFNLCILLIGKASLCQKTMSQSAESSPPPDDGPEESAEGEANKLRKGSTKQNPGTETDKKEDKDNENKDQKDVGAAERRRSTILAMVTNILEQRKSILASEKTMKRHANEVRRMSMAVNQTGDSTRDSSQTAAAMFERPSRSAIFGKAILQHSEGSYFGGTDMSQPHNQRSSLTKSDQFTYVSDMDSLIMLIPKHLMTTIVQSHYENTISDKERVLNEHRVTEKISKLQKSALLHEMVEERYIQGNVIVTSGRPTDVVYMIKSGFARIYMDVKVPKVELPEAVQHYPSTQLQQRKKTLRLEVMDVGPGEFVGGLEQLCGENLYLFTVVATCETVAYNMRAEKFKEIVLRPNSRPLTVINKDIKQKFRLRRQLNDLSLRPDIEHTIAKLLGEAKDEVSAEDHLAEAMKSDCILRKRSVPQYMLVPVTQEPAGTDTRIRKMPPRGPFADRVRDRMIELGFKSRRGT